MINILSLGAGVQSSTLLLMSCVGDLPKPDAAIFADTGWEPKAVYAHLGWLASYAGARGIPVIQRSRGNLRKDALVFMTMGADGKRKSADGRWASMPVYVLNPDGSQGMIRRQCTSEYKIAVTDKFSREIAGIKPRQRVATPMVKQWIGISTDEASRMRDSQNKWQILSYPLIEKRMSRADCLQWLRIHDFPIPPKSSCIGCPFHSDYEWRWLRDSSPEEFEDACQFDEAIRNCGGMRGEIFLHRSCKPLREVDLSTAEERGQVNWINECYGMCGV